MTEPISFFPLLEEAARITIKRKSLWIFVVLFGMLAFLGFNFVSGDLPETFDGTLTEVPSWVQEHASALIQIITVSLGLSLLGALFRGSLFLFLQDILRSEAALRLSFREWSHRLLRASVKVFTIEFLFLFATLVLVVFLFIPVFFAWRHNTEALPLVANLAALFLFGVIILFYFIKEYALLYFILTRASLRNSFDLGYMLLRKNFGVSLIFGMILISLSFVFTFILDSAIIVSARFFDNSSVITPLWVLFLSGIFSVYENTLRLVFFHSIAAQKSKDEPIEATETKEVSETPA